MTALIQILIGLLYIVAAAGVGLAIVSAMVYAPVLTLIVLFAPPLVYLARLIGKEYYS